MFENFVINVNGIWNIIDSYIKNLLTNPLSLITLILDLFIVIYLFTKFIIYAKKSRVWQLIKGIILFLIIVLLSEILQLKILNYILTVFMPYGVILIIVIFQPELRRMLEQLGTNKFTKLFGLDKDIATKTKEDIYKVVIAATELSKIKTGALIVLERDININDIAETGVKIDAEVSPQLLVNLFTPKTPLHDGAIIISNNKIEAAACILPLANDADIAKELGTRHRAALGIAEETDAISLVVSEETGRLSIAIKGELFYNLSLDDIRMMLIDELKPKVASEYEEELEEEEIYEEDN